MEIEKDINIKIIIEKALEREKMIRIELENGIYFEYENDILKRKYTFYPNGNYMWKENIELGEKNVFNVDGKLKKRITSKNGVSESLYFYSTGELFRRKLVDEKNEEEYIEYYSRKGEIITKLKNHLELDYSWIYDLNSKKYLIFKNNKLYYNGRIYFGRVKYYRETFLIEESYNKEGNLNGVSKISYYEGGVISETFWKDGVMTSFNYQESD